MESLLVIAVLCVATLLHSTTGFGTGLIAMPVLSLLIGVQDATALVAFAILGTTLLMLRRDLGHIEARSAWKLVVSSLVGVPIGIFLIANAPDDVIRRVLGVLLVAYAIYNLVGARVAKVNNPIWAYCLGFMSGVLGGAYNTNSPPVIVYATMRRWPPRIFRATLQAYFLPLALVVCIGHGVAGFWSKEILTAYLVFFPFSLVFLWFGKRISTWIPTASFYRVIYVAIILLGVLLLH